MGYNNAMTFGQQLKQRREALGISLDEIAQKTHIRMAYLEAIEAGHTERLPSQIHLRGFLRLYASELGLTLDELEVEETPTPEEAPENSEVPAPETNSPTAA